MSLLSTDHILLANLLFAATIRKMTWLEGEKAAGNAHAAMRPGRRPHRVGGNVALIVASIFLLKIFAYTDPSALSPSSVTRTISLAFHNCAPSSEISPSLIAAQANSVCKMFRVVTYALAARCARLQPDI